MEDKKINIYAYRGQAVWSDTAVAAIYGVTTREVNRAIKKNPFKFPKGYVIELEKEEWKNLKSKNMNSSWRGKRKPPTILTEKGLNMIATILKSDEAVLTTIEIMESFFEFAEIGPDYSPVE